MGIRIWHLCTVSWVGIKDSSRSSYSPGQGGRAATGAGLATHFKGNAAEPPEGEGTGLVGPRVSQELGHLMEGLSSLQKTRVQGHHSTPEIKPGGGW